MRDGIYKLVDREMQDRIDKAEPEPRTCHEMWVIIDNWMSQVCEEKCGELYDAYQKLRLKSCSNHWTWGSSSGT